MTNSERCKARYLKLNATPELRAEYIARREWEYVKSRLEMDGDFDADWIRTPDGIVCYAACCLMWLNVLRMSVASRKLKSRAYHRAYGAIWRAKRTQEQIDRDRKRSLKSAAKFSNFKKTMVVCNFPKPPMSVIVENRKLRAKERGQKKRCRKIARLSKDAAERRRKWHREHIRKLRAENPQVKMACCLRSRVLSAMKSSGARKASKTMELLGCSVQELKAHLESKFKPGMNWTNHTKDGWHIDHILPCASFDLTDPSQQRKCFHFTNLQPLWATDNRSKSARVDSPLTPTTSVAT